MDWVEHAIWWHVFPLGSGGPAPGTELGRLERWLDYAIDLGASGLQLGPIFRSTSHGYDSLDQFAIDPRLGDLASFDRLVAACHARGLRLMLDGVFNHVGSSHPWFVQALREGPDGEYASFFTIDWSGSAPRAESFEGHDSLVALNHDEPQVAEYVASVMNHWLERGADAWRLDAAYAVDPAFWARVLPGVRERHPSAWFVGEVIHGDYPAIVAESGLDSVTQYELWKAIWSSLLDGNFFELDWALTRHNGFVQKFLPLTFVGNHDVTRIASTLGADTAVLALVLLMTTPGVPVVYYGDERAFLGVKEERAGGDDAIRPPLPADPSFLRSDGAQMYRIHQELIGLRRRHHWLTRATTRALHLENTRYVYEAAAADGSAIVVELSLQDGPWAKIRAADGSELFSFTPVGARAGS